MDKITAIKIKGNDGTYSDTIPISALAENVQWNDTHTLTDVLGNIDIDNKGSIQEQIDKLEVPSESPIEIDSTLAIEGAAADAKATGDVINRAVTNSQTKITSLQQELASQKQINDSQNLEIEKLKAAMEGDLYLFKTDSKEAYEKTVPEEVKLHATLDKVGGKTLVWNQLFELILPSDLDGLTYTKNEANFSTVLNGTANISSERTGWYSGIVNSGNYIPGNKYLVTSQIIKSGNSASTLNIAMFDRNYVAVGTSFIKTFVDVGETNLFKIQYIVGSTFNDFEFTVQCYDLTLMFGAGNEPATPEEFRAMFPADYYPYSEPQLMNFSSFEIVSRGKNLFDPSVFDGAEGITKSGDEYYGKMADFYSNFTRLLPLDCATIPKKLSISIRCLQEFPSGATGTGLIIYAVYTDGSEGYIIQVPPKSSNWATYTGSSDQNKIVESIGMSFVTNPQTIIHLSNIMITAGSTPEDYIPYRSVSYDTSAIVQKYFPGGMKSAGSVHDEIDFERGVAIQRVGSVVYDGVNVKCHWTDDHYNDVAQKYNYAYAYSISPRQAQYCATTSTIGRVSKTTDGFDQGGVMSTAVISLFIPNVATESNTKEEYVAAFNEALKQNPVEVTYELETPIETPITELFEETIEVTSGGALTFKNDQGDNFQIPVPNQETFMIKLMFGGGVV